MTIVILNSILLRSMFFMSSAVEDDKMVTDFEQYAKIISTAPLFGFAVLLFVVGLIGFAVTFDYMILPMLALEIMIFASVIFFSLVSVQTGNEEGFVASLFLFAVAAAESVVGLALITIMYRLRGDISLTAWSTLRK